MGNQLNLFALTRQLVPGCFQEEVQDRWNIKSQQGQKAERWSLVHRRRNEDEGDAMPSTPSGIFSSVTSVDISESDTD